MKKKKFIFIAVAAAVIIAAIILILRSFDGGTVVQNEARRKPSTGESWTVMVYMCGSTLEEDYGRASEVLGGMMYDLPENVNVLVETGGSRAWHLDGVYSDYIQDFEIQKNGIRLVNQKTSASMGDSSTLKSFLKWGIENYPAEHYISVIWNHGGGPVGGVAYDSKDNYNSLSLKELTSALSGLSEKLDIIGFDASLMSNLETAASISLYADYMVASEDLIPMSGWDYKGLFEYISENPSAPAAEVGKVICDGVMAIATESDFVSMAVTDLSKETMLSLAFDGMAKNMSDSAEDLPSLRNMMSELNNIKYLGGNSLWEGYSNLVDIGEFANVVSAQMGKMALNINNAIDSMVVYKSTSDYHSGLCGLSIYYPYHKSTSELSRYKSMCTSSSYMQFIEKTCASAVIPERSYNYEDTLSWQEYSELVGNSTFTASTDATGQYILSVSNPEIITRAEVNFYHYDEERMTYLNLGRDYNVSYDAANGQYTYEFSGRLPQLNGSPVAMYLVSKSELYDIYSIPVIYNGAMSNLRVMKSKQGEDAGEYKILGRWKGIGRYSGMAYRKYTGIESGDTIIPIYEVYGDDTGKYVEGDIIRVGFGGIKISDKVMADGEYIVSYFVEDVFDEIYESNPGNLTAEDGKVKVSAL